MNIVIFCLTLLAIYGIVVYAHKAWKKADIKDKFEEVKEIESQEEEVLIFKKSHRGNLDKKRKTITDFTKE